MIGEQIKRYRLQKGLSLSELARRSGVSKSYLSTIERNLKSNPTIQFVEKVAPVLGVTAEVLLHDELSSEENKTR